MVLAYVQMVLAYVQFSIDCWKPCVTDETSVTQGIFAAVSTTCGRHNLQGSVVAASDGCDVVTTHVR